MRYATLLGLIVLFFVGFTTVATAQTQSLDGFWDDRFGPQENGGMGVKGQVRAIGVHPVTGDVYVGGDLSSAGNVRSNRIARWDGTQWHPLGDGTGGRVHALAFAPDGTLFVGGVFPWVKQTDGTLVRATNIARWDGEAWSKVGLGVTSTVYALEFDPGSGNLYVGGRFPEAVNTDSTEAGSARIVRWDGVSWNPLGQGLASGDVETIAVHPTSGQVAIAGLGLDVVINSDGTEIDTDGLAFWNGSAWSKPDQAPIRIEVLEYDAAGRLIVGGGFVEVGDLSIAGLARFDGEVWQSLGGQVPDGGVKALALEPTGLFVAGTFTEVMQDDATVVEARRVAYLNLDEKRWLPLGDGVRRRHTPLVNAIAVNDGLLYTGGVMAAAGGVPSEHFAVWHQGARSFAATPVRFAVDTRPAGKYDLVGNGFPPSPFLQVLTGALAGLYYTFDDDGDGIHSIEIDQPAGQAIEYVFLIDRSGDTIHEDSDAVFELDPPSITRQIFVPTNGQPFHAPVAPFDDRHPTGPAADALEYDSEWFADGDSKRLMTQSHVHELRLEIEGSDRTVFVGVWQTDDDPAGTTPPEILQIANELLWTFETYPAAADYKMKVEWDYSEMTGIADPNDLRILHRIQPDSVWKIVPTEVVLNDEELHTPGIERLVGDWTVGSITADNVLTNLLPETPSNPRPEDGILAAPLRPNLRWDPVLDASSYEIYVWPATESQPSAPSTRTNIPLAVVGPLTDDTEYHWRVIASNLNGSTDGPVWSFTVGQTPDLVVSSLEAPTEAFSNQDVTISWTVSNDGDGSTNVPRWFDTFYLSSSIDFDPESAAPIGSTQNVGALAPQEQYGNQSTFRLPRGIEGSFYVVAMADGSAKTRETLDEGDESNNIAVSDPISVTLEPFADLEVAEVVAADLVFSGDSIDVTWTVSNVGTGQSDVDEWFDTIFLSEDDQFNFNFATNSKIINISELSIGSLQRQGVLEAGDTYTVTHKVKLPTGVFGDRHLFVSTDTRGSGKQLEAGDVYEFNKELNNWTSEQIGITLTPPPDLRVTEIVGPAEAESGQQVPVRWTVTNEGPGVTAGDRWLDVLYQGQSAEFDPASAVVLGVFRRSGVLVNDSSYSTLEEVRIPDGIQGLSYFFVRTDAESNIFEHTFEANNFGVTDQPTEVSRSPYPDLTTTNVTLSTHQSTAGQQIVVSYDIGNAGTSATVGSWTDSVYVLNEPAWDPLRATSVGGAERSDSIEPGQKATTSQIVTLPAQLDGDYYVFVLADARGEVFEYPDPLSGIGRSGALSVSGYPPVNLEAAFLDVETMAGSGDTLRAHVRISNSGDGRTLAERWFETVYLSEDEELDLSIDDVVAEIEHEGKLTGNDSYETTVDIFIPEGVDGDYFLVLETDRDNSVAEVDETDNSTTSTLSVRLSDPADLVVSSVSVSDEISAGDRVEIGWTVTNDGAGQTRGGRWFDSVYLLKGETIGRTAIPVGTVERPGGLAGGDSYETSLEMTVPAFAAGRYNLTVVTDIRDDIYEHLADGNNMNRNVVELTLPLPSDLVVSEVTGPAQASPGDDVEVNWTITNTGSNPAKGHIRDAVFVSTDAEWDVDDPLLGVFERVIDLAPGTSGKVTAVVDVGKTFEMDARGNISAELPGLEPGSYHFIVRADAGNSIRETDVTNNDSSSGGQVNVSVPMLTLGLPESFALGIGQSKMYTVEVGPNEDLRIALATDSPKAGNELYVAFDRPPTPGGDFDFASAEPFVGAPALVIPSTSHGPYYVTVLSRSLPAVGTQSLTLLVELLEFSIESVSPYEVGQGRVTIELTGAGFRSGDRVFLVNESVTRVEVEQIEFIGSTQLRLRSDLTGTAVGTYDVVLERADGSESVTIDDALQVERATNLPPITQVAAPDRIRAEGSASFRVEITNPANTDIQYLFVSMRTNPAEEVKVETELFTPSDLFLAEVPEKLRIDHYWDEDGTVVTSAIGRDMAPGQTVAIQIEVSGFLSSPFNVLAESWSVTEQQAVEAFRQSAEATRTLILSGNAEGASSSNLPMDKDEFASTILLNLVERGLLDLGAIAGLLDSGSTGSKTSGLANTTSDAGCPCESYDYSGPIPVCTRRQQCGGPGEPPRPPSSPLPTLTCDQRNERTRQCHDSFARRCQSGGSCFVRTATCAAGAGSRGGPAFALIGGTLCALTCIVTIAATEICDPNWTISVPRLLCRPVDQSCDPNDILGPDGYSDQKWVGSNQTLPYTIRFENDPALATASAQVVGITHPLDPDTDERTFRLGSFGFGPYEFNPPENVAFYRERLDVTDSLGVLVDVTAGIDVTSNRAFWRFTTIDPKSGDQPVNDPDLGFLPINDGAGSGEGFVTYTINADENAETGAKIDALADIVFDMNAPIETPAIFNTLDASPPVSTMDVLPSRQDTAAFHLTWTGTDVGSGIQSYSLFVSEDGGPFEVHDIANDDTSTIFIGEFGNRYRFFIQATDNSGNIEPLKNKPEAFTTVSSEEDNPAGVPREFALHQSYPNPFNPSTTIPFDLPENGNVEIAIYDIMGRLVTTVDKGALRAGYHQHLLRMDQYASGVYVYQLRVTSETAIRFADVGKFVLIK